MGNNRALPLWLAVCTGAAVALWFGRVQVGAKRARDAATGVRAHKADLHEWENEGGNQAPVEVASSMRAAADGPSLPAG